MDRSCQRLVKQNSGGVFTVGERQAAIKNVDALSDLLPSAVRIERSKQEVHLDQYYILQNKDNNSGDVTVALMKRESRDLRGDVD